MNWSLWVPLIATILVAIGGWFVLYRLSTLRDRENKKRDLRVQYLIEAYRRLEDVGNRPLAPKLTPSFESAVADIQLFGTLEQVRLARQFALEFAKHGSAPLDPLLESLRRDLREELRLPGVSEPITYLRITHNREEKG